MSTEAFPVDPQAYEDLIEDLLMARHFAEDERLLRMDGFLAKGRMLPLLESMPVRIVLDDRAALLGAARFAATVKSG